jgi:FAD/FMN-containing dehydrogenase
MMDKPMTAAVRTSCTQATTSTAERSAVRERRHARGGGEEEIVRMSAVLAPRRDARRGERDEAQRLKFWSGRKNAFPASGRISPDYMCMDSTIPRKRLADILLAIQAMEKKYGLACCNVFHAGDGNLHPLILFDANDPDQLHRCELFGADILETSVAMGGTVTASTASASRSSTACACSSARGARADAGVKARLRPARGSTRQGDPDAAALRRVRAHAREEGAAAVCRAGALLGCRGRPCLTRSGRPGAGDADRPRAGGPRRGHALAIRGGNSKSFYGGVPQGEPLDISPLTGISSYEPSELVVTVRAGTPLAELEAALAERGQCLPFEPPRFGSRPASAAAPSAAWSPPDWPARRAPRSAACVTTCSAPRCSTAAPSCSASAARS